MALQVCSRCRKRKIRCDLQLPSCKNCRAADVECLFWDEFLGREISCSYLHSLRQKVASLQLEIKEATTTQHTGCRVESTDPSRGSGDSASSLLQNSYHLSIYGRDGDLLPSRTAYLGPGSSARLLERVLKDLVKWHVENDTEITRRLLPDQNLIQSNGPQDLNSSLPSFPINNILNEQRKLELYSMVPPSTQRSIIEHYLITVAPEYTLLPAEQESALLSYENPLRWSSGNKGDLNALALTIVFAISTGLIARDFDPNLAGIALRCRQDADKLHQGTLHSLFKNQIETERWMCIAFCASVLFELINPLSGQTWDLLGRAASSLERLREGYQLKNMKLDEPFRRLERTLLKLESSTALHLHRPSYFNEMRLRTTFEDSSKSDVLRDELQTLQSLHNIAHHLQNSTRPSESFFLSLIPRHMQVYAVDSNIPINSAMLYLIRHPLFTSSEIYFNSTSNTLFHIIAHSASTIIDHFAQLNTDNKIISISMAAERILESGIVWSVYLINRRLSTSTEETQSGTLNLNARASMSPILKVSSLLSSFAVRWQAVSVYVEAWETLVDMLWNLL